MAAQKRPFALAGPRRLRDGCRLESREKTRGFGQSFFLRELRLAHLAPLGGNACKSQLNCVEISEVSLFFYIFTKKLPWKHSFQGTQVKTRRLLIGFSKCCASPCTSSHLALGSRAQFLALPPLPPLHFTAGGAFCRRAPSKPFGAGCVTLCSIPRIYGGRKNVMSALLTNL